MKWLVVLSFVAGAVPSWVVRHEMVIARQDRSWTAFSFRQFVLTVATFLLLHGTFAVQSAHGQSLPSYGGTGQWDPYAAPPANELSMPWQVRSECDPAFAPLISPDWRWVFLPQGFLYHTYWASAAEPRLSTRAINDSGGHNSEDSQIGGRIGIVRFGNPKSEEGVQLDLLAGVNLRQNLDTSEWDMTGTDYRFDIPLTYRQGPHALKFGFYHVSSHTGDEFLVHNPFVSRIDYWRNAIYLGYSYYVTPEIRIYGEIDYAFAREFSEPWHFQFGFDWGPVRPTGVRGAPFLAVNAHLREELNWGGNVSLQAGWAWKGEGLGAGTLRTGLHYYNGGSSQFSFYQENEQQIGWGLWYDF